MASWFGTLPEGDYITEAESGLSRQNALESPSQDAPSGNAPANPDLASRFTGWYSCSSRCGWTKRGGFCGVCGHEKTPVMRPCK